MIAHICKSAVRSLYICEPAAREVLADSWLTDLLDALFPVGLIMVVLTWADLFTSYCMYSVVALLHRRCNFLDLLKTWFVSFFGNLAGALFFMAVLTGCKISHAELPARYLLTFHRWGYFRVRSIQHRSFSFCKGEGSNTRVASNLP